jgi:hypothetical protein
METIPGFHNACPETTLPVDPRDNPSFLILSSPFSLSRITSPLVSLVDAKGG